MPRHLRGTWGNNPLTSADGLGTRGGERAEGRQSQWRGGRGQCRA